MIPVKDMLFNHIEKISNEPLRRFAEKNMVEEIYYRLYTSSAQRKFSTITNSIRRKRRELNRLWNKFQA